MIRIVWLITLTAGLIVAPFVLTGCPPAHVNPLDPESDQYVPPIEAPPPPGLVTRVRSVHTSRNIPSTDTYSVLCEVWSEEQGTIDSAWVSYRDWPPAAMLLSTENIWSALLTSSYFNDPHLESVIGIPFTFYLAASNDSVYSTGPAYLFRVIESTPVLRSPRDGETMGSHPQLVWEQFPNGFPFTFRVSVYLALGEFDALVWSAENIARTDTTASIGDSLVDGDYYWTLHVIDNFGNTSRSKEGVFTVQVEAQP